MTKQCELCHGTGQRCYFGGESRFVLTWQDCPACFGTGEVPDEPQSPPDHEPGLSQDAPSQHDLTRR
jgi:DnaJ-class molecular chaperone